MDKEKRKAIIYAITKWAAILTGFLTLVLMIGYALGTVEEIRVVAITWLGTLATTVICGCMSLHISDD